jgi:glutamyl-tRNA synthetase
MAENSVSFYREPEKYDEKAAAKHLKREVVPALETLRARLSTVSDWIPRVLHAELEETARQLNLDFGKLAQPVRVALTGRAVSPPIDITLHLVGRDRALKRLARAAAHASVGN